MYMHRTGSNGAIASITGSPKTSAARFLVARHGRGSFILSSPFSYARSFSGCALRSIVRGLACGDVSSQTFLLPRIQYDVMNTRPVVLGGRVGFCLFPVFAVHRRPTRSSWFHTRRAWLGGIWRHCVVHRIGQLDRCEGTHRFWMRLYLSILTPLVDFPRNRYGP